MSEIAHALSLVFERTRWESEVLPSPILAVALARELVIVGGPTHIGVGGRGDAWRRGYPTSQRIAPTLRGRRHHRPRVGRGELPPTACRGSADATGYFPDALVLGSWFPSVVLDGAAARQRQARQSRTVVRGGMTPI